MRYPLYKRYLVTDKTTVHLFEKLERDASKWLNEMAQYMEAEGVVVTSHIAGLIFDNDAAPEESNNSLGTFGWYKVGDAPDTKGAIRAYFMPRRDTEAGKYQFQTISLWIKPTWAHFQRLVGLTSSPEERDGEILWAHYERMKGAIVINVPFNIKKHPKDTIPIKESEYWKMREENVQSPYNTDA